MLSCQTVSGCEIIVHVPIFLLPYATTTGHFEMTSSGPPFAAWSKIDHSGPIAIITLLTLIFGLMVYAAGMIIKFTTPGMKYHHWWNNVFWTLSVVCFDMWARALGSHHLLDKNIR